MNCQTCEERGKTVPATSFDGLMALCRNCEVNEAEAAHERMLEDYYGGSGPVTLNERYQEAVKERAELRRRD